MKNDKNGIIAALLIAAAAAPVAAQQVWRCGNQYSQQPCAGGAVLQPGDPRTPDDAARAQSAVRRQEKAADELEKARLAQEAKAAPANILPQNTEAARASRDTREYKPVHFTAIAPKSQSDAVKTKKKKKPRKTQRSD